MASKAHPAAHLSSGGPANLTYLYDVTKKELLNLIGEMGAAEIALVLDQGLFALLDIFSMNSDFQRRGVAAMHPLGKLGDALPPDGIHHVAFIVRPNEAIVTKMARLVRNDPDRQYTAIFVPHKPLEMEKLLEREGVRGNFAAVRCWQATIIPLDRDLLTLDDRAAYMEYRVRKDSTPLYNTAKAIMQIQMIYGIIPRIVGKGAAAKRVAQIMSRLNRELDHPPLIAPEIESCVIVDRDADLITPLCTQFTYEGVIDEVYGIDLGRVQLPPQVFEKPKGDKPVKRTLNSGSSQVYRDIRGMSWLTVGPYLAKRTKRYASENKAANQDVRSNDLKRMKQVASKLKDIQAEQMSLPVHINLTQELKKFMDTDEVEQRWHTENDLLRNELDGGKPLEFVEKLMFSLDPHSMGTPEDTRRRKLALDEAFYSILRLICMHSLVSGGLKPKVLASYKKDILDLFGFEKVLALEHLEAAGLLSPYSKKVYPQLDKALRLMVDRQPGQDDGDISFAYLGYCPLSVRLIDLLVNQGSEAKRTLNDVLELIPGPLFDTRQPLPSGFKAKETTAEEAKDAAQAPVTLVVFVGGCSVSELACLRHLSKQQGRDYIVLTSTILTGTQMLQSLDERVRMGEAE
eukprot:TRINITY_DN10531_c0_g1_i2.p1 TRINITY_DN10531_c0_g1~~TRINITY_DN10531_c0_g1_i2.p1  ORF type:complete len:629 (+),score=144.43 TRINITY_DN10531_c0_g1_i2:159-2045(+)